MNPSHYAKKLVFSLFLILFYFIGFSQSSTVKGYLTNSKNTPIELASVVLMNPKDSTVVNYSITDNKGYFQMIVPSKDSLLFQASFLGYKPYYEVVVLKGVFIDLKTIKLKEDISTLDVVTISAVVPVQIKKDTVAFNASSFKVNHDDTIESLLGKLPGVEVDSDGKIVAQGNQVSRIFVDGKEFFSGDPAIVLKNLSANAISKVEVIDKKSDEAELTGVDDGNKEVIINFTLKKNKKNQGFGNLSGGIGLDSRYFGNINYNRFNDKTQTSIVGKFNNINITGSNIRGFLQNADGITGDSDDNEENNSTLRQRSLSGFLTTGVAGVHLGHEYKKKESLNADYFYNHTNNNGLSSSNRITFAISNNFDFNSDNDFDNTTDNHNFNFNYENKSSKKQSLRIKGGYTSDIRTNLLDKKGRFIDDTDALVTTNNFDLKTKNDRQTLKLNMNYYRRLQKQGRNFSAGFFTTVSDRAFDNLQNTFITRNIGKSNESEREQFTIRDETIKNTVLNLYFNYTEPLWERHFIKVQGVVRNVNDKEDALQSRITITDNNEEKLNFKFENKEKRYTTIFLHNYIHPKWYLSYGAELQDLNRAFGADGDAPIIKNQFYLNPQATLQYKPKRGSKHHFNYRRIIRSPRSSQITTVVNDLNPFFIRTGNPDLKTEKIDQFDLNNTLHDFKSSISFYSKIRFQYIRDAIISNVLIDEDYIRTRTFENTNSNKRLNTNLSLSKKVKTLGIRYTLKNKNLFQTSNALINNELNDVTTQDYSFNLSFENSNKRRFDAKTGATYSINNTSFSLENDLDREFTRQDYYASFDFEASKKLNLNTQLDYIIFNDNKFTNNQELPLWNATLSYSFSRETNNILKLVLIDILDKNVDIFRRSTINYFEETTTESLGRYVILSYLYKLNGQKRKTQKKNS